MKVSNYFWGFLLIASGTVWLDVYFDFLPSEFSRVHELWPLALIFLGIMLFNIPKIIKSIFAGFCGILLTFVIYSYFHLAQDNLNEIKINIKDEIQVDENDFFDF